MITKSYDDAIGRGITQTSKNIFRRLSVHLKEYDITPEQWTVLKRLGENDGVTQKELSSTSEKDQATLTRILDILERKRLMERKPNKEDRRSFLIYITESGKQLSLELFPLIEKIFNEEILVGINEEEIATFSRVLDKIKQNTAH